MDQAEADLERELTCAICLEFYRDPLQLPCLHSFCKTCLDKIVQNQSGKRLNCPDCRKTVDLGKQGLDSLQKNFKLASIVDIFRQATASSFRHPNPPVASPASTTISGLPSPSSLSAPSSIVPGHIPRPAPVAPRSAPATPVSTHIRPPGVTVTDGGHGLRRLGMSEEEELELALAESLQEYQSLKALREELAPFLDIPAPSAPYDPYLYHYQVNQWNAAASQPAVATATTSPKSQDQETFLFADRPRRNVLIEQLQKLLHRKDGKPALPVRGVSPRGSVSTENLTQLSTERRNSGTAPQKQEKDQPPPVVLLNARGNIPDLDVGKRSLWQTPPRARSRPDVPPPVPPARLSNEMVAVIPETPSLTAEANPPALPPSRPVANLYPSLPLLANRPLPPVPQETPPAFSSPPTPPSPVSPNITNPIKPNRRAPPPPPPKPILPKVTVSVTEENIYSDADREVEYELAQPIKEDNSPTSSAKPVRPAPQALLRDNPEQ